MDALVMCGGRGRRLDADVEKPLYEIGDRPMIASVLTALHGSGIDDVRVVVTPHTPRTKGYAERDADLGMIETAGTGYVEDLQAALDTVSRPVLTVAADLPLLDADAIDLVLGGYDGMSTTVGVPVSLKASLGLGIGPTFTHAGQTLTPAGINIVDTDTEEQVFATEDVRFAVNVNTRSDARVAERLL